MSALEDVDANNNLISKYSFDYYNDGKIKLEQSAIPTQPFTMPDTVMTYTCDNWLVYRGGNSFKVKPNEIRIDKAKGLVKDTHGISLDINPDTISKFGGAYQIESLPEGLKIVQRGARAEHFEIVPAKPMPLDEFQGLLNQIKTSSVE